MRDDASRRSFVAPHPGRKYSPRAHDLGFPLTDAPSTPSRARWEALAVGLATTLAYMRLWWVDFSWDDETLVVGNESIKSLANPLRFFVGDLWSVETAVSIQSGYYRPLWLMSVALDHSLFGLSSAAAHVHSLLWHLLAAFLLWRLCRALIGPKDRATERVVLFGAALFALHPVQSEVLALVAARNDSMATALGLGALLLLTPTRVGFGRLLGALVLALSALLSKESAALLPLMLLALDLGRFGRPKGLARYLALLAAVGAGVAMRMSAGVEGGLPGAAGWTSVIDSAVPILGSYAGLVVWPWPLTPARYLTYLPATRDLLPGLVVFLLGAFALFRWGRRRGLVLAGLAIAALAWGPSLAATADKGLIGERYLYFAMAGLGLSVAAGLRRLPLPVWPALVIPAMLALGLRAPQWQDSRTVWEHAHVVAPTPFSAAGLGWYLARERDFDRAIPLLVEALQGDPPRREACDLVVMTQVEAGQPQDAVWTGSWALRSGRCPPGGLMTGHLAWAQARIGRWDDALRTAGSNPAGPSYPGQIAIAAASARKGDLQTVVRLARAARDNPIADLECSRLLGGIDPGKGEQAPIAFALRTIALLAQAGEGKAAGQVRAMVDATRAAIQRGAVPGGTAGGGAAAPATPTGVPASPTPPSSP